MNRKNPEQCEQYTQLLRYLVCGACAMMLNTLVYWLMYECVGLGNVLSSIVAWLVAVVCAFVGNKYIVFRAPRTGRSACIREFLSFFGCRIATGALDVLIMVVAVDHLGWNSLLWKWIANGIVTVTNYGISRFWIFSRKE